MPSCDIKVGTIRFPDIICGGQVAGIPPGRDICIALLAKHHPTPYCPFNHNQQLSCPLAAAIRGEITIQQAINLFKQLV